MKENQEQLDKLELPRMLQYRLKAFDVLQADLDLTTQDDKKSLQNSLEMLSHELMEDLEDELGELIEHNQMAEPEQEDNNAADPQAEDGPSKTEDTIEQEQVGSPPDQTETTDSEKEAIEEQAEPIAVDPISEDEKILEKLVASGTKSISGEALRRLGFRGGLSQHRTQVGKYLLYKGRFDIRYTLTRTRH